MAVQPIPKTHSRDWSDWAGFVFMLAFGIYLLRRQSSINILLLPTAIHQLVLAWAFLIRRSAKAKTTSFLARLIAYSTTLMFPVFTLAAQHWYPKLLTGTPQLSLRIVGSIVWFLGCLFGVWGVWVLRYGFSIEPQARRLVTRGPYRFARHPIYLSYLLQYGGVFLMHDTPALGAVLALFCVLLYFRIRYEERILGVAFPEYRRFQASVGALWPHLNQFHRSPKALRAASS